MASPRSACVKARRSANVVPVQCSRNASTTGVGKVDILRRLVSSHPALERSPNHGDPRASSPHCLTNARRNACTSAGFASIATTGEVSEIFRADFCLTKVDPSPSLKICCRIFSKSAGRYASSSSSLSRKVYLFAAALRTVFSLTVQASLLMIIPGCTPYLLNRTRAIARSARTRPALTESQ
ncbi:hypothetical protein C8R43DRAFT_977292 [Mycena crocata]|nr:hypothetical protein C8R43DRAFT_977292 [Mycena crocata]